MRKLGAGWFADCHTEACRERSLGIRAAQQVVGQQPEGQWRNWQRSGLQNRRLGVRVPPALRFIPVRRALSGPPDPGRGLFNRPAVSVGPSTADLPDQVRLVTTSTATKKSRGGGRSGGRLFLRQVVAELKKVVRPTRNELITYTSVVLVFVIAVMTFVSGLDYLFGKLVLLVFGGGGS